MPDGRGSEESTIFVAGLPDDMTNLEMHRWKNGCRIHHMRKCCWWCVNKLTEFDTFSIAAWSFSKGLTARTFCQYDINVGSLGWLESMKDALPQFHECFVPLFHVPTQPENHANQVSAVFSFWSYCTQRWERMRSTNVHMADRSPGSAWNYHIIGWFLELRPGRGIWNILVKPIIPLYTYSCVIGEIWQWRRYSTAGQGNRKVHRLDEKTQLQKMSRSFLQFLSTFAWKMLQWLLRSCAQKALASWTSLTPNRRKKLFEPSTASPSWTGQPGSGNREENARNIGL